MTTNREKSEMDVQSSIKNVAANKPRPQLELRGAVIRASAFLFWDRGFDSRYRLMWKESVNALSKVVGFLQVLRFPPTGKVDRVG
jgi:hypothetical protein